MRALFLGAPIMPAPGSNLTAQQRFDYLGKNTGNLLIGQSLLEELDLEEFSYGTRLTPEEVDERFDVIIVPSANFIFRNFDFGYLADYIEKTNLPAVMVGVGAQAPSGEVGVGEIPEGTLRLLKIIGERSKLIGVRGYFTASVLGDFGIKNVLPIGCPSLYRRRSPTLQLRRFDTTKPLRVVLNGSRNVYEHAGDPAAAKRVESAVLRYAIQTGTPYVLQNEFPEISVAAGDTISQNDISDLNTIAKRMSLDISGSSYGEAIHRSFKVFFSLEDWDAFVGGFDFCFGSRFHGNVAALTNSVPAVVLTHDTRTQEMCQYARIPSVKISDIPDISPSALMKGADFEQFENHYSRIYADYKRFLFDNDLPNKL